MEKIQSFPFSSLSLKIRTFHLLLISIQTVWILESSVLSSLSHSLEFGELWWGSSIFITFNSTFHFFFFFFFRLELFHVLLIASQSGFDHGNALFWVLSLTWIWKMCDETLLLTTLLFIGRWVSDVLMKHRFLLYFYCFGVWFF